MPKRMMTYWKAEKATIGIGHRVPVAFFDPNAQGKPQPELGMAQDSDPDRPVGEMRALLFWKYRLQPTPHIQGVDYLVHRCDELINSEFREFLVGVGCNAVTIARAATEVDTAFVEAHGDQEIGHSVADALLESPSRRRTGS